MLILQTISVIVLSVTAKSVIRIITPELYKAQQDAYRPFLLPEFQHTYQFMAGLEGLLSSRPVSLYAGGDNPFSPVTKSELSLWVTGSKIQGVNRMTDAVVTYPHTCQKALSVALRALAHLRTNPPAELREPVLEAFISSSKIIARKSGKTPAQVQKEIKRLQKEFGYVLPCRSQVVVTAISGGAK